MKERCWLSLVPESSQEGCPEGEGGTAGTPGRTSSRSDAGPLGGQGWQGHSRAGGWVPQWRPRQDHPRGVSTGRAEAIPAGPTCFSRNGFNETLHGCNGGSRLLFLLLLFLRSCSGHPALLSSQGRGAAAAGPRCHCGDSAPIPGDHRRGEPHCSRLLLSLLLRLRGRRRQRGCSRNFDHISGELGVLSGRKGGAGPAGFVPGAGPARLSALCRGGRSGTGWRCHTVPGCPRAARVGRPPQSVPRTVGALCGDDGAGRPRKALRRFRVTCWGTGGSLWLRGLAGVSPSARALCRCAARAPARRCSLFLLCKGQGRKAVRGSQTTGLRAPASPASTASLAHTKVCREMEVAPSPCDTVPSEPARLTELLATAKPSPGFPCGGGHAQPLTAAPCLMSLQLPAPFSSALYC